MENETFESALLKLEDIIRELESGEIDLDKSLDKYKEATTLVNFCSDKLKNAQETVNKILKEDGTFEDFNTNEKQKN